MHPLGFVRITATSMETTVANPAANVDAMIRLAEAARDSDILLFPELAITGYTCADLFLQDRLLDQTEIELVRLVRASESKSQLWVVGVPIRFDGQLFNTAAVIHDGRLLGLVPKQFLPTYQEFYERRWFSSGKGYVDRKMNHPLFGEVPFGSISFRVW